jgi:hypothetical protein
MKTVEVNFTGAAREITREKSVDVQLDDSATYEDLIEHLAECYPGLVGTLIGENKRSLLSANLFARIGEEPMMPEEMILSPKDGERIIMLYFIVGG